MTAVPFLLDTEGLRHKWAWLLALGVALIILGTIALLLLPITTVAAVMVLGWVLVISGVVEAIHAFRVRGWGGVFLHVIGGALGVVVGLLIVTHPVAGALVWTLLLAAFFTVIGLVRTVAATRMQFPNWGWAVFDGIVTLALGILLWAEWPFSGAWFLGFALGISLILRGWSYVMFSLAVHSLASSVPEIRRAA